MIAENPTPELPTAFDPVETWRADPSPQNLSRAVETLRPQINYQLHRYGLGSDPLAEGQARLLAAKALQTYDPASGAGIATWLDRSMQPLSRLIESPRRALALR